MKRLLGVPVFLILNLVFMAIGPALAADAQAPDILVKISRIDNAMALMDKMAAAMDPPATSPSFFPRSLLFGTDWIDPSRSIVIGLQFNQMQADAKPVIGALVPFVRQSEDFQISYNAAAKRDHYVLSLPPGQGGAVSDAMAEALDAASRTPAEGVLFLDMAASQMLAKAGPQIEKWLQTVDDQLKAQPDAAKTVSSEDVSKIFRSLLDVGRQMQTLSLGADFTESDLSIFSTVKALPGTDLAALLTRQLKTDIRRMGNYRPGGDILFQCGPYDVAGMMRFFNAVFGEFYRNIGLDLAGMETLAAHFTGETAGGLSFTETGLDIEMMAVLSKTQASNPDFLASVYMPWLMDYGQKMAGLLNPEQSDKSAANIFTQTPETVIDGHRVFGVSGKIPGALFPAAEKPFDFTLRTTAVGDILLTASSDDRLRKLLKAAGALTEAPHAGPLMRMEMDLGAYLDMIRKMTPANPAGWNFNPPELGKLVYTLDMDKGTLTSAYFLKIKDIQAMAAAFPQAGEATTSDRAPVFPQPAPAAQKPEPPKEDTPAFWVDKGMLYATYGNHDQAIRFFEKALAIDPENPPALFNQGLSYSSLGNYDKAVDLIRQALSLAPDNGDYQYGLAWVFLNKGDAAAAMPHMEIAADLGNADARKYLMHAKHRAE